MKKILAKLSALTTVGILIAQKALASIYDDMKGNIDSAGISLSSSDPEKVTGVVIKSLLSFLGIIFFLLILYAGFLWMTAAGQEEKISKAKKILISSAIGITIVFGSYAITTMVLILLEQRVV